MNTICIGIGILFFICVLIGWAQGLFRVVISVAGLIASLVVATYAAPRVTGYLEEKTQIDEQIADYIVEELEFSDMGQETTKAVELALIEELALPETLKEYIKANNGNDDMYQALEVSGIYDYISKSIAVVILNAAVFLLLTFICRIFFFFLGKATGELTKLPIVRSIDKIGGGVLGAMRGLILIWIFFLILSITSTFSWSQEMIVQIHQVVPLKWLYDNNILLDIVGDLTKVLFL